MDHIVTSVTWKRGTKGTHLYEEDDNFDVPSIRNMYLAKAYAEEGGEAPKKLGVIIAPMLEDESLHDFAERILEEFA